MFFAKEINYLATRMAVLAKANALVDMLHDIPSKVLETDEGKILTNAATDFDDAGFEWYVPSEKEMVEHSRKKMENGKGFYETKVKLEVSQETPRFEAIEKGLNTAAKIFFTLTTTAFDKDEELINKDAPYAQEINLVIIVDRNGVHINEHTSYISIDIEKFKELIPDDTLPVDRKQMEDFFDETLKAIDAVNGSNPDEGYFIKFGDSEFNTYGIRFDEDRFYHLEDEEKFDVDN